MQFHFNYMMELVVFILTAKKRVKFVIIFGNGNLISLE